uniref:BESS domain-containing protein n=1 Tax=Bactrocera latifrons TaxID=174628 RepID=A0A0K8V1Z9_BACLA
MNSLMDEILPDESQDCTLKETSEIEVPTFSQQPLNYSRKPVKTKRSEEGIGNALLQMEKEKLRFLQEKRAKKDEDDEDLCFFKSLLPHVKNMSSSDKIQYRIKVLQLTHEWIHPKTVYIECANENTMASTTGHNNAGTLTSTSLPIHNNQNA